MVQRSWKVHNKEIIMATPKEIKQFCDKVRKFASQFKRFDDFYESVYRNFNPKGIMGKSNFERLVQTLAAELNMK